MPKRKFYCIISNKYCIRFKKRLSGLISGKIVNEGVHVRERDIWLKSVLEGSGWKVEVFGFGPTGTVF